MASLKLASFSVFSAISAIALLFWICSTEYLSQLRFPPSESLSKQATRRVKGNKESVNNDQDNIWFLETSYQRKLLAREACSIESACRNNGDFTVHLLSTGNISSSGCPYHRLLSKLPNFRSMVLNASLELAETPLKPLHATGGALNESPHKVEHLSDFLRYVVLWKHGGVYLDTDVIVMKSLRGISNSVFYQSENKRDGLANGILFFDKQHPVLRALINECARVYDPHLWTVCGPALISQLLSDAELSRQVKLLSCSYFFRVPFTTWEDLFNATMAPGVLRAIYGSYGVHFWNKLSKGKPVAPESGSAIELLARSYCPETYGLAISEGYF
ncbi:lactosylceramide 4-alpha-galactosyltransferase-like [Dermacentor albipictus]|uniref:lactosylceramide 4-alpha-galactosyltransferase-like n=1 Tax=Dermacentor albipictus TaxID=60249 RepID=UPI0038FCCDD2